MSVCDYLDFQPPISSSPTKSGLDYESEDSVIETDNSFDSGRETMGQTLEEQIIEGSAIKGQGIDGPLLFEANYLLFGTFMSFCRSVELTELYLKMSSVSPNILGIRFSYNISISFSDITRLMYCSDSLVFIELNVRTSRFIQTAMNLGDNSPDGLRFDVNSNDVIERYIVIDVTEDQLFPLFVRYLLKGIKVANNPVIVKKMSAENARRYVCQNHRKCEASHRLYRKRTERNDDCDPINSRFSP